MANNTTPPKTMSKNEPTKHHYAHTFFACVFGFISLNLILLSILVVWLGDTLTNTNVYVKTVSSIVADKAVQDFVSSKASEQLTANKDLPIRDIAQKVLPADQLDGKTDDQLRESVKQVVKEEVIKVLASQKFKDLWVSTNKDVHSKLLAQVSSSSGDLTLDLQPTIKGAVNLLNDTRFAEIKDKMEIPTDKGTVKIESSRLDKVRKIYSYFIVARIALVACAILSGVLAVLISVHHTKTLRRILLLTGIFTGLLALLLSAGSLLNNVSGNAQDKALAIALVDVVLMKLRLALFVISGVSLITVIGSKLFGVVSKKQAR